MKNDIVSIIVPVYNGERSIKRTLDSILSQTYKDIEVLVIDDGSIDNTESIVKKLAEKDKRIRPITQENKGAASARNRGLEYATGKYIMFVDSDDYMETCAVETMITTIQQTHADIVVTGFVIHNNDKARQIVFQSKRYETKKEICDNILEMYKNGLIFPLWNKLYIKDKIIDQFNTNIILGEDFLFNLSYFKHINRVEILEKCIYHYINDQNNGSLSNSFNDGLMRDLNTEFFALQQSISIAEHSQLPDLYIRKAIRVLRKAYMSKCGKERMSNLVKQGKQHIETNYLNYPNAGIVNRVFRTKICNEDIKSICFILFCVSKVYQIRFIMLKDRI